MNFLGAAENAKSLEGNGAIQEMESSLEPDIKNKTNSPESVSSASTLDLIKRGTTFQAIRALVSEYSNYTSIHGIKYFGARNQPWYERLFWFIVVSLSMYLCVDLTLETYSKWRDNPVIVSLAETSTPVWEVPFPTVTVCPLAKSKRDVFAFNTFLRKFQAATEDDGEFLDLNETAKFEAIAHVCLTNSPLLKELNFTALWANETLVEILKEMSPLMEDVFSDIKWRRNSLNDFKEIQQVLTDDGLCFSFNALEEEEIFRNRETPYNNTRVRDQWSLENGYVANSGIDAYPRRVLAGDIDESLHILLSSRYSDSDPDCSGKSEGFKVILHTPGEFPQVSKRFFRVPYKQLVLVAIQPNMITTSEKVRTYDPDKRQCFFNTERYLKYFKIYTQGNCEHECLTNATLEECSCVKYSMPKDPETPYCGSGSIQCYIKVKTNILKSNGYKEHCNCLPACTSITYDAEVTQSVFNYQSDGQDNDTGFDPDIAKSTMNVFFASNQFLPFKRSELYGIADLIANIGGLFGLFMGVSILSVVEIIYFCTIRLGTSLQMRKASNKSDQHLE